MACPCQNTIIPTISNSLGNCYPCNQITPCIEPNCACPVLLDSKCITNISVDTPCVNIPKGLPFNEWMPLAFTRLCDKLTGIVSNFVLKNIGLGVGKLYKGISIIGEKEIKSIKAGNLVTITNLTDEVEIAVDNTALTTFVNGLEKTSSISNLGTVGAKVYNETPVLTGNNTDYKVRRIVTANSGLLGESILKTEIENANDITISAKKINSKGSLEITSDIDNIYVDIPMSTQIPGLYVNNAYKPTYQDFLNPLNQGKGEGTLAKPFTDTRVYTSPTVFTDTLNTSIQNALDNYAGGTTNANRLNPLKSGQKIKVQDNGVIGGYTFPNTYNYNILDIEFLDNVNNTFSGLIVDMDNPLYFQSLNSSVTITYNKVFQCEGDKFKNSGNAQSGNTYQTGKTISLIKENGGEIYSGLSDPTKYLIQSIPNNENSNNNDGALTFIVKGKIRCFKQGVYKIGGNAKMDFTDSILIAGDLIQPTDINLKPFVHNGGSVRCFGKTSFNCGESSQRVDFFQFNSTLAFPIYVYFLGGNFAGSCQNLFTKTNTNTNVYLQVNNTNSVYGLSVQNIFESPNIWKEVDFDKNSFANGLINPLKIDLTQANQRSVINTIDVNKIESLITRPSRALSGLPIGSVFINTNNAVATSTWFRDIMI